MQLLPDTVLNRPSPLGYQDLALFPRRYQKKSKTTTYNSSHITFMKADGEVYQQQREDVVTPGTSFRTTQICIVRHQQEGNNKHVCANVLFPNYTDFPELVIAVKNKSCERIQTAGLVCPAHHVLLYITAMENRRARTRLHCPTCKVTRSFESPSGFNSETLAKQG